MVFQVVEREIRKEGWLGWWGMGRREEMSCLMENGFENCGCSDVEMKGIEKRRNSE